MNSPARASMQRKLAALANGEGIASSAAAMPTDGPVATEYALLLAALSADFTTLSNTESTERKIEAKRGMIDRYRPWLEGAMQAQDPVQDEIVGTMAVWSIDIGDWPLAYDLAAHILTHGIALPERYRRKPATLIAEEVAQAGLTTPPTIDYEWLAGFDKLTADCDMHDQVRAKLKKAMGLALVARADAFDPTAENQRAGGKIALIDAALDNLNRAKALNEGVGVKKLIERLESDRRKLAEAPPPQS
jgi:hypothetical protein